MLQILAGLSDTPNLVWGRQDLESVIRPINDALVFLSLTGSRAELDDGIRYGGGVLVMA